MIYHIYITNLLFFWIKAVLMADANIPTSAACGYIIAIKTKKCLLLQLDHIIQHRHKFLYIFDIIKQVCGHTV